MTEVVAVETAVPEIRRFSDEGIAQAIEKVLSALPENKNVAVVAYADQGEARLAAYARIPGLGLSFMGILERKWSGELKAEAALAWSI